MAHKWYVVHTYSGFEEKAKQALLERSESLGMADSVSEVLVPAEKIVEVKKGGEKKTSSRQFFPGYILVKMELSDATWHLIKDTPKITGFVGNSKKPSPVSEKEIERIFKQVHEGAAEPKQVGDFSKGETIKVSEGPFGGFTGVVEEVNQEKSKLKVLVSIFGRSTPLELDFTQVQKT
ncbi:MAG: transcription termination/antitermination factor NusG [Deltaproteobacteria bacterium]|nr:transcription termination/antitermination factor NusG [Deltaproteobacteria bacterium]